MGIKKRTVYDPNDFIIEGNVCKIGLYNKQGLFKAHTLIDTEDCEKCKQRKWGLDRGGYVVSIKPSYVFLHNFILDRKASITIQVDHKDRNPLNNTKENLRLCTPTQNQYNSKRHKHNTSGFKGVDFYKQSQKWRARIKINGKSIELGLYDDIADAAEAYKEAARKYHGEFANID